MAIQRHPRASAAAALPLSAMWVVALVVAAPGGPSRPLARHHASDVGLHTRLLAAPHPPRAPPPAAVV